MYIIEFAVLLCRCEDGPSCITCEGSGWFLEHYDGYYTPGSDEIRVWVGQHRGNTPLGTTSATVPNANPAQEEMSTSIELNFDVLPLGETGWEALCRHYASMPRRQASTGRQIEIDDERLRRIRQLNPDV
jgi:hypothetical protein